MLKSPPGASKSFRLVAIISWTCIVFFILAILWFALGTPTPHSVRLNNIFRKRDQCAENMRMIGNALAKFAQGHAGGYPLSLNYLPMFEESTYYVMKFGCPFRKTPSAFADYVYYAVTPESPPSAIVLSDKPDNHQVKGHEEYSGRNVLLFSGTVLHLTEPEFRALLKEQGY